MNLFSKFVRKVGVLLFVLATFSATATDTTDQWTDLADAVFQHYTQEHGLPQPIATALAEDGDGFLWIGTQGGLARWDGYRFRNYLPNPKDPGALKDNFINTLYTDPAGRLWIGTSAGGVARYDRNNDRFITYRVEPGGLSSADILAISGDGSDGLWIATESGLNHLEPKTGTIKIFHHDQKDPGSLPDDRETAVLQDTKGVLWVGSRTGLARRAAKSANFKVVPLATNSRQPVSVRSLYEDPEGHIWIGTGQNGAYVIDTADGIARAVVESGPNRSTQSNLQNDFIHSISAAGPNEVWLGAYGDGIISVNTLTHQTHRIRHDPKLSGSLLHDQVWAMMRDRAGSMWIGSTGGLDRMVNADRSILTVISVLSRQDKASDVDIESVLALPNGLIWLGMAEDGAVLLDLNTGMTSKLQPDLTKPDSSLPTGAISALTSGHDEVFIGTNRGVYRCDPRGKALHKIVVPHRDPAANSNALLFDHGALWIGGPQDGVWAYQVDESGAPVVTHLGKNELTDQRVNVIYRGLANDLWVGTSNGLNRLDLSTGKVEQIAYDTASQTGLSAGYVTSLQVDPHGRLWVGLLGGGIDVMTDRDNMGRPRFRHIGGNEGLPNDNINKLLMDRSGNIWVSTDDGLVVIDPDKFTLRTLHRAEGVAVPAYWANSGTVTPDGELLFGGAGGLTVLRADLLQPWHFQPAVVVTDVRIGGKLVLANDFNGVGSTRSLNVDPDANSIAAEFSALDFTSPDRNHYSFQLDGFDKTWVDTDSSRRLASYNNLPPGSYTLHIRGSNRDGQWAAQTLNLPINVLPAWYQTWLFRVALLIAATLLIVLLVQARTAYLLKAKLELEALVEKRTEELSRRTEELHQSKLQLEEIAFLDALTGLPNRRLFTERFDNFSALAQRNNQLFALLLIDLDKFKHINDTFGHDAGDAVLVATAQRLKLATRAVDVVARLGGDEFAILLVGPNLEQSIQTVCDRIVALATDPIEFNEKQFVVSMSLGAAIFTLHGKTQADLYKAADLALYEAKASGRNAWRCSK